MSVGIYNAELDKVVEVASNHQNFPVWRGTVEEWNALDKTHLPEGCIIEKTDDLQGDYVSPIVNTNDLKLINQVLSPADQNYVTLYEGDIREKYERIVIDFGHSWGYHFQYDCSITGIQCVSISNGSTTFIIRIESNGSYTRFKCFQNNFKSTQYDDKTSIYGVEKGVAVVPSGTGGSNNSSSGGESSSGDSGTTTEGETNTSGTSSAINNTCNESWESWELMAIVKTPTSRSDIYLIGSKTDDNGVTIPIRKRFRKILVCVQSGGFWTDINIDLDSPRFNPETYALIKEHSTPMLQSEEYIDKALSATASSYAYTFADGTIKYFNMTVGNQLDFCCNEGSVTTDTNSCIYCFALPRTESTT